MDGAGAGVGVGRPFPSLDTLRIASDLHVLSAECTARGPTLTPATPEHQPTMSPRGTGNGSAGIRAQRARNVAWHGLPLQGRAFRTNDILFNDGSGYFRDGSIGAAAQGIIYGRLYRPSHEEVGGLFPRDGFAGAFAGKRDR